jgi:type I restriction enzyme, S subunit
MSGEERIPKGYKQTEVGVIPEDWGITCVRDLVAQGPQNGYSGRCGKDSNGTPTLSLSATSAGRFLLGADTVKYLEARIPAGSPLFLRPGDVLVQRSNTAELVGTTAIYSGPPATFVYPDLMMRMRFREDATAGWFWRYANSWYGRRFFSGVAAGSTGTMPKISGENLRIMPLPLPSLPEREAIAQVLTDADALIESLEQLIAKKRLVKQGAMQELLTGKRRLPGFERKKGYKQTEVGMIPEDWEVRPLGSVVDFLDNQRRPVKDGDRAKMRGSVPYYGASGIVDYVNDYLFDEELILLGEDGENILSRNCRLAFRISGKAWVNNHAHVLRPNQDMDIGYLADFLESLDYGQYNSGTAQPKLNKETCSGIPVALPPTRSEQSAIASILSSMDSELAVLEEKLLKARAVKQGMMQELLTGRKRLNRDLWD